MTMPKTIGHCNEDIRQVQMFQPMVFQCLQFHVCILQNSRSKANNITDGILLCWWGSSEIKTRTLQITTRNTVFLLIFPYLVVGISVGRVATPSVKSLMGKILQFTKCIQLSYLASEDSSYSSAPQKSSCGIWRWATAQQIKLWCY